MIAGSTLCSGWGAFARFAAGEVVVCVMCSAWGMVVSMGGGVAGFYVCGGLHVELLTLQ